MSQKIHLVHSNSWKVLNAYVFRHRGTLLCSFISWCMICKNMHRLSSIEFSSVFTCPSLEPVVTITFNVQQSVHPKYIPIYIQQDATLHSLFISGNCSTCFGWYHHPPSGAHTTVSTASGTCQTVTATCCYRGYHPKHVEQFPYINKLCNVVSSWIYVGIYPHVVTWDHHVTFTFLLGSLSYGFPIRCQYEILISLMRVVCSA